MRPADVIFCAEMGKVCRTKQPVARGLESVSGISALIEALQDRGFKNSFKLSAGQLVCLESAEKFAPQNAAILGIYRFEGASDPQDLSIVYALEMDNGTRGIMLDAFGPEASPELGDFIEKTVDRRHDSEIALALPTDKTVTVSTATKDFNP